MKVGENLSGHDIINSPKIKFNYGFLSKIPTKSFVLIFVNPKYLKMFSNMAALQWIRYYSSSLDEEEDICCYKDASYAQNRVFRINIFALCNKFESNGTKSRNSLSSNTRFFSTK